MDNYNGSCTTNSPLFVLYFTYFILVENQFVLVACSLHQLACVDIPNYETLHQL